jgi:hypothetical protein
VGATATVQVAYREPGVTCTGTLVAQLEGGLFDGLPRPAALAALALSATGLWLARRPRVRQQRDLDGLALGPPHLAGRPLLGAAAGTLAGFGAALVLLLWSVVPLESSVLTLGPLLGLTVGVLAGRRRSGDPGPANPQPGVPGEDPRPLPLIDL